ncbi:MAG: hypothetical protein JWM40_2920 [Frankiales bacterium]|nr:hypothetical protein [Frankiales bacterium]
MTWDAATTVIVPSITLVQKLGDGMSNWVELALIWDSTHLQDADDGTSRDGTSGAPDGVPAEWSQSWMGLSIDWGDGTSFDTPDDAIGPTVLWQNSTSTIVGDAPYSNEAGEGASFLPTHFYQEPGTYEITVRVWVEFFSGGVTETCTGVLDLTTFTTGARTVPTVDAPRDKLVGMCHNLNYGRDAGNFLDASFLISGRFDDLRSSGPCTTGPGFHGVTAREPWAPVIGGFYEFGELAGGAVGNDIWLQTVTFDTDELTPAQLALWPTEGNKYLSRIIDGGPDVALAVDLGHYGSIKGPGGAGITEYNNDSGFPPSTVDVRGLTDGTVDHTDTMVSPDWVQYFGSSYTETPGPAQPIFLKMLNDREVLMRFSTFTVSNRIYICDTVSGDVWLTFDYQSLQASYGWPAASGFPTLSHFYLFDDYTTAQAADGTLFGSGRYGSGQRVLFTLDRSGRPVGQLVPLYYPGSGTLDSFPDDFEHDFDAFAFTGILDPDEPTLVYVPLIGHPSATPDRWATGIYRVDVTDPTSAVRVAWLEHPYALAVDSDGNEWNAWDYIDTLMYGNPLDGDWLPPGPAVLTLTLPPLRQVGRADGSRQYPRAHLNGLRQVGRTP